MAMTLRDIIDALEDIARRCGDRLDVEVIIEDDGQYEVTDVVYAGGRAVELRT